MSIISYMYLVDSKAEDLDILLDNTHEIKILNLTCVSLKHVRMSLDNEEGLS